MEIAFLLVKRTHSSFKKFVLDLGKFKMIEEHTTS